MAFVNSAPILIALAAGIVFVVVSLALIPQTPAPMPERVAGTDNVARPCENAVITENSSGTFYTCPHASEISNIVFDLPPPVYKKVACAGPYGCSRAYHYTEIVPPDLLSEQQMQTVIDKVMNLPETRLNSGWQLDHFLIQPREDRWFVDVQLFLPGIMQLPPSQECGWYGSVALDLETLEILGISNIPPRSDVKCENPPIEITLGGLKDEYRVGEIIYVSAAQEGGGCGVPEIFILNENLQIVLVSRVDAATLCPAIVGKEFFSSWEPHKHGEPIIINQTGTYTMVAEFETKKVEHKFTVVDDHG